MRDTFLNKGKNKVDDTGQAKHPVAHPKSRDFVRLSSESTPENPRMLGGTLEEAQAYLEKLSSEDRKAYSDYIRIRRSSVSSNEPDPTAVAKEACPRGYEIYSEYHRRYGRKAKKSTNQPGESSTTRSSTGNNWHWTDAIYQM